MGQFWYFGGQGDANKRQVNKSVIFNNQITNIQFQVSKIVGCEMVRQNDMAFDFNQGSCNSFAQPKPRILLCFDVYHTTECHT